MDAQACKYIDVLGNELIVLREHYDRVARENFMFVEMSMKKKYEGLHWIDVIDNVMKNPSIIASVQMKQQLSTEALESSEPLAGHGDQSSYDLEQFEKEYLIHLITTWTKNTKDNAERVFKAFKIIIGNRKLCEYTAPDLENYKAKRMESVSPNTVNMDVRTLKAAFNIAVEWKKIKENPFRKEKQVKNPEQTKQFISDDEFIQAFDAIEDQWIKDLVSFDVLTGMRLGEVMNLKWVDYDKMQKLF